MRFDIIGGLCEDDGQLEINEIKWQYLEKWENISK